MTLNKIKSLRSSVALTQAAFAELMGVPFRTLQDLESGQSNVRDVHMKAAKWAVLEAAQNNLKGMHIPEEVIEVASRALETYALRDSCPICGRPGAKMAPSTGGDYSEYTCENCGTFRISGTAEAMWGNTAPVARFRALAEAKSKISPSSNDVPMIMSYHLK
ncbi:helix-turn-helix domain-containing protein [Rhizobium laguerreae]|uniref:helix-turn-helix domain-containing protein n=1 Tax=Rhizobium laguerreae TaxID=1076926 RepID=UPI001C9085D6|nr:hypothetical protein [Rhizobium laguerreae]